MNTTLETRSITKEFDGLKALNNVNIEIEKDDMFGLIGPNGSGKSTLVNVMTGFLSPEEGSVLYKGEDISGLKSSEIASRGIVRTFQVTNVFSNLTVLENLLIGSHLRARSNLWGSFLQTKAYQKHENRLQTKAVEVLELLEMRGKSEDLASSLGLGEQRKLGIAIALVADPEVLLLDEPAAGLNPNEARELVDLLLSIQESKGITFLIVEHHMDVIMSLCNRIAVLNFGEKIAEGIPKVLQNDQKVISVYLGESGEDKDAKS